ncbi:MAG TPA: N-acetylmuramoyl-L-alanine amidase, partial [bacterium]|nr:N-acetylmuramoyl-L-alanine amidase [bacterium]
MSILVLCSKIYAGEFVFEHNGKNIKMPSIQINDNEYVKLSSFLEPLSIKPVYNRVLHKISFNNSKDIFILSPISDAVAIDGNVLMFEKPLVVNKGVIYVSRAAAISLATKLPYTIKKRTVMIDPGHGGSGDDGLGAKAEFNDKTIYEKNITLSFAKKLGELLQNNGYIVSYTRTNDKKIPLAERTSTANNDGTNIFISIHANSSIDPMARGADVFYMSEEAEDAYAEIV